MNTQKLQPIVRLNLKEKGLPAAVLMASPLPVSIFANLAGSLAKVKLSDMASINEAVAAKLPALQIVDIKTTGSEITVRGKSYLRSARVGEQAVSSEVGVKSSFREGATFVDKVELALSVWYPALSNARIYFRRVSMTIESSPEQVVNGFLPLDNSKIQIHFGLNAREQREQKLDLVFIQEAGAKGRFFKVSAKKSNEVAEDDSDVEPTAPTKNDLKSVEQDLEGLPSVDNLLALAKAAKGREEEEETATPYTPGSRRAAYLNDKKTFGSLQIEVPYGHIIGSKHRMNIRAADSKEVQFDPQAILLAMNSVFCAEESMQVDISRMLNPLLSKVETIAEQYFASLARKAKSEARRIEKKNKD